MIQTTHTIRFKGDNLTMKIVRIYVSVFLILILGHSLRGAERNATAVDMIGAWKGTLKMTQGQETMDYHMLLVCDGENLSMIEKEGTSDRARWNDCQFKIEAGTMSVLVNGSVKDTMQMKYDDVTDSLILTDSGQSMTLRRIVPKT